MSDDPIIWRGQLLIGDYKISEVTILSTGYSYIPAIGNYLHMTSYATLDELWKHILCSKPERLHTESSIEISKQTMSVMLVRSSAPRFSMLVNELSSSLEIKVLCGSFLNPGMTVEAVIVPPCKELLDFGLPSPPEELSPALYIFFIMNTTIKGALDSLRKERSIRFSGDLDKKGRQTKNCRNEGGRAGHNNGEEITDGDAEKQFDQNSDFKKREGKCIRKKFSFDSADNIHPKTITYGTFLNKQNFKKRKLASYKIKRSKKSCLKSTRNISAEFKVRGTEHHKYSSRADLGKKCPVGKDFSKYEVVERKRKHKKKYLIAMTEKDMRRKHKRKYYIVRNSVVKKFDGRITENAAEYGTSPSHSPHSCDGNIVKTDILDSFQVPVKFEQESCSNEIANEVTNFLDDTIYGSYIRSINNNSLDFLSSLKNNICHNHEHNGSSCNCISTTIQSLPSSDIVNQHFDTVNDDSSQTACQSDDISKQLPVCPESLNQLMDSDPAICAHAAFSHTDSFEQPFRTCTDAEIHSPVSLTDDLSQLVCSLYSSDHPSNLHSSNNKLSDHYAHNCHKADDISLDVEISKSINNFQSEYEQSLSCDSLLTSSQSEKYQCDRIAPDDAMFDQDITSHLDQTVNNDRVPMNIKDAGIQNCKMDVEISDSQENGQRIAKDELQKLPEVGVVLHKIDRLGNTKILDNSSSTDFDDYVLKQKCNQCNEKGISFSQKSIQYFGHDSQSDCHSEFSLDEVTVQFSDDLSHISVEAALHSKELLPKQCGENMKFSTDSLSHSENIGTLPGTKSKKQKSKFKFSHKDQSKTHKPRHNSDSACRSSPKTSFSLSQQLKFIETYGHSKVKLTDILKLPRSKFVKLIGKLKVNRYLRKKYSLMKNRQNADPQAEQSFNLLHNSMQQSPALVKTHGVHVKKKEKQKDISVNSSKLSEANSKRNKNDKSVFVNSSKGSEYKRDKGKSVTMTNTDLKEFITRRQRSENIFSKKIITEGEGHSVLKKKIKSEKENRKDLLSLSLNFNKRSLPSSVSNFKIPKLKCKVNNDDGQAQCSEICTGMQNIINSATKNKCINGTDEDEESSNLVLPDLQIYESAKSVVDSQKQNDIGRNTLHHNSDNDGGGTQQLLSTGHCRNKDAVSKTVVQETSSVNDCANILDDDYLQGLIKEFGVPTLSVGNESFRQDSKESSTSCTLTKNVNSSPKKKWMSHFIANQKTAQENEISASEMPHTATDSDTESSDESIRDATELRFQEKGLTDTQNEDISCCAINNPKISCSDVSQLWFKKFQAHEKFHREFEALLSVYQEKTLKDFFHVPSEGSFKYLTDSLQLMRKNIFRVKDDALAIDRYLKSQIRRISNDLCSACSSKLTSRDELFHEDIGTICRDPDVRNENRASLSNAKVKGSDSVEESDGNSESTLINNDLHRACSSKLTGQGMLSQEDIGIGCGDPKVGNKDRIFLRDVKVKCREGVDLNSVSNLSPCLRGKDSVITKMKFSPTDADKEKIHFMKMKDFLEKCSEVLCRKDDSLRTLLLSEVNLPALLDNPRILDILNCKHIRLLQKQNECKSAIWNLCCIPKSVHHILQRVWTLFPFDGSYINDDVTAIEQNVLLLSRVWKNEALLKPENSDVLALFTLSCGIPEFTRSLKQLHAQLKFVHRTAVVVLGSCLEDHASADQYYKVLTVESAVSTLK